MLQDHGVCVKGQREHQVPQSVSLQPLRTHAALGEVAIIYILQIKQAAVTRYYAMGKVLTSAVLWSVQKC